MVSNNKLTDGGAKHLSDALKSGNCKLTELVIGNNVELTNEGVKYLSDALKNEKCSLTDLWIGRNKISIEGMNYLRNSTRSKSIPTDVQEGENSGKFAQRLCTLPDQDQTFFRHKRPKFTSRWEGGVGSGRYRPS